MAPPSLLLPQLGSPRHSSPKSMAPPSLPRLESPLPAGQPVLRQQMAIVAAGGADPISSSPAPAASTTAPPTAPPPVTPTAGAGVRGGSGDPLHHAALLTPPHSIPPGSLVTPDQAQLFLPDANLMKAEQTRVDRDGDVEKLFQFFRECKEHNEYFYWDVDFDPKTKVLRSIFWSHASQRAEYRDFGDVITFDTTHKTNSKHMPLAMFVGCSSNLKNVSFGQALLRDETIDTFKWLFETFKSCMGGRQPFVILTDEDPAMREAIKTLFDKTT